MKPPRYLLREAAVRPLARDQRRQQIESSGIVPAPGWAQVGTAVLNSCLIRPFVWLQHLFRNTRAGTGFVVVASPRQD